jgi:hypothetical protein
MIEKKIYCKFPAGFKEVRPYTFYQNIHNIHITFNNEIESIDDYAFYNTVNFEFDDISHLNNLKEIGMYAFARSSCNGLDHTNMPNSIQTLNTSCFAYVPCEGRSIRFPDSMTVLGQSSYRQEQRAVMNSVDLSNLKLSNLPAYTFYNLAFGCDFEVPTCVKTIGMYMNQEGCFNNVKLHSNITNLQNYCFGCRNATAPLTNFYLRTVTIECVVPPTIGTEIFAPQHVENGFKIYVPDESLEAYKNVTNLQYCKDCIFPMSQKD